MLPMAMLCVCSIHALTPNHVCQANGRRCCATPLLAMEAFCWTMPLDRRSLRPCRRSCWQAPS